MINDQEKNEELNMNNLANKLRTGIQESHNSAEHTGFMTKFLKGEIDQELFAKLLSKLYYIYSQLEAELEFHKNDALVSHLYFAELNRKANLEQDLAFHLGENWREKIAPSPAVLTYVSRLREVSETEPVLLIAHAYTRYMGDLSGGQALKKIAQTALNLDEHQGTNFYEFDQISEINAFKGKYRQALNELPIDEALEDKIVAEANTAFRLNIKMLAELEGNIAQPVA